MLIALVADDLTGASDAGVQFARRGLVTRVVFDPASALLASEVETVALDTDSRGVPAAQAYERVKQAAERLRAAAPERVYKKVDSTLRGNLGAEIDALMDAFDLPLAIVAPGFPSLGRSTRNGIQYLNGQPVHLTEVGRDLRESSVARLLEQQSGRRAAVIDIEDVERGPAHIHERARSIGRDGASLVVCDAETNRHLQTIAEAFAARRDVLWVGSAGLAEHLAALLPKREQAAQTELPIRRDGPVLVVVGSLAAVTARQVATLAQKRKVVRIEIDPLAPERARTRLQTVLDAGSDSVLLAPVAAEHAHPHQVAQALGGVAAACVRASSLAGLVLTGGETARAVARSIGASGLELLAEVEPGVPVGWLLGETSRRLLCVTKAGAFGSAETLVRALDHLKGSGNT